MGFLKKLKGVVVINNVDETEGQTLSESPRKTHKIKKKTRNNSSSTASNEISSDNMAELTEDAHIQKKKELDYKRKPNCMDNILFNEKLRIFYVILLCLALGLAVPYGLSKFFQNKLTPNDKGYCGLNITYRMECLPGSEMNEEICNEAKCCYDIVVMDDGYAPLCFHAIPADYSYEISSSSVKGKTFVPQLRSSDRNPVLYNLGDQENLTLPLTPKKTKTPFKEESWNLKAQIQRKGDDVVRIKIWDPNHDQVIDDDFKAEPHTPNYKLEVNVNDAEGDFNISVVRRDGKEIFNSVFGPLIYSENYTEITGRISTTYLYGFGQRGNFEFTPAFGERKKWALFNYDSEASDDGSHSSHPFYMNVEDDGSVHGVYMRNTAPMEVGVYPIPAVVFRTLGGSIDLRFFAGPTPQEVSRQFVEMVGKPAMPPFWALGYHLCRTTSNATEYDSISEEMENQHLPYESDCLDARLNNYPDSFANLSNTAWTKIQALKDSGRKFWLVQYPFVKEGSNSYGNFASKDLLLQVNGTAYYGMVDNKTVGYPDYLQNNSLEWMMGDEVIKNLYSQADGIILFRNSPLNEVNITYSNTTDGGVCNVTHPINCCPEYPLKFRPIGITDINNRTLCASVLHEDLLEEEARLHLRTHNVYGQYHHQRIYEFKSLLNSSKRPIVTSQSTFSGSGAYGGQFGGNYQPNFVAQQMGLVQILQMGLYGIPFSGVPICGSTNNTNDEMRSEWCLRAHQVAAFLPFAMSHYEYNHTARNPPNFSEGFMSQIKYFIRQRYMMLPYMYTLFYEAYQTGVPVVRPLFYEFPMDKAARRVMSQFVLGPGLLVSPVFSSVGNGDSINTIAHFPPGCWYDFFKGSVISHSTEGENIILPTLLTDINVHILGGKIIPLQGNLHTNINTTADSRQQPLMLLVALPCNLEEPVTSSTTTTEVPERKYKSVVAQGNLYMDDGETQMGLVDSAYLNLTFEATINALTITSNRSCEGIDINFNFTTSVDIVRLFGVGPINQIQVNGNQHKDFTQDPDNFAAYIFNLDMDFCKNPNNSLTWS